MASCAFRRKQTTLHPAVSTLLHVYLPTAPSVSQQSELVTGQLHFCILRTVRWPRTPALHALHEHQKYELSSRCLSGMPCRTWDNAYSAQGKNCRKIAMGGVSKGYLECATSIIKVTRRNLVRKEDCDGQVPKTSGLSASHRHSATCIHMSKIYGVEKMHALASLCVLINKLSGRTARPSIAKFSRFWQASKRRLAVGCGRLGLLLVFV